jgi:Zn-dependent protease with chaperone function
MDSALQEEGSREPPPGSVVFFDGRSSRRRTVSLALDDSLAIREDGAAPVLWAYDDIRQADGPPGMLRVNCLSAPPLARLEIRDTAMSAALVARCAHLHENRLDGRATLKIVGWSLAAVTSIVLVVLFAIPFAADRLAPLVPQALERRLGDAAAVQIRSLFGGRTCNAATGQKAFERLVGTLREAAGLDPSVISSVVATPVPNAIALPGGQMLLFSGLLDKAGNPDEIAGVLAHELGHLKHRDNLRNIIHDGSTSFLIGLLFGDVTGSSTIIFATRTLMSSSYSRDVEQSADTFAMDLMQGLGRPIKPMGELLFRVTGKQGDTGLSILASHPLTEDRLLRMSEVQQTSNGPPLLTPQEWTVLKAICSSKG